MTKTLPAPQYDPSWGFAYLHGIDVSYRREDNGSYSVWEGEVEVYSDGTPCWEPFASFQPSYDRSAQEMVEEVAERHGFRYAPTVAEIKQYGHGYDPRTYTA